MLLAPLASRAPRDSPQSWANACRASSASTSRAVEVAGPGFLNLVMADSWFGVALSRSSSTATPGEEAAPRRRADRRRVRLRQPDRADARRPRAQRRLRRFGRADPRLPRPRGHARVLRQRLRLADRAARRVDACPRTRRGGRRGRLPGRLRRRSRGGDRRRRRARARRARSPAASQQQSAADPRFAGGLRGRGLRHLVLGAVAARGQRRRPGRGSRVEQALARLEEHGRPTAPTARCGCGRASIGDDKDRVLERSSGEHTYFSVRPRLPARQARRAATTGC